MLQTNQQKLDAGGTLMTEAARTALQKEIDREQKEGERLQQDAQASSPICTGKCRRTFRRKLLPVLADLSKEKGSAHAV